MQLPRPPFRPDIEGLRGVAILLVVLFHAGVSWLAGGFVGVDVFFVLSGYFITSLLVREMNGDDRPPLSDFYGRRALRLMPALLVVLLTTLALVMWLYAPIDRANVAKHARAVALSWGNMELAATSVDYFSSQANPLLHTWSLAVEEQFYLVWPLLFIVVAFWRKRRPHANATEQQRPLLIGIAIAGVLSFIACLWLTTTAQPWAFFGMPMRVWEFALGGALAVVAADRTCERSSTGTALQVAGMSMIAAAIVLYHRATPYPGIAAMLPALGAVAMLAGGARAPDSIISRALSNSVLRWLGRVSYAWYLWHWPLVGLAAVLDVHVGVWGKLAWSLGALGLAWLTHRYVETPSRQGRGIGRLSVDYQLPAAIAASLIAAAIAHGAMGAAERRASESDQRVFAAARVDRKQHDCWATTVEDAKGPCEFGDTRSSTTLVLLGDSHAEHWLGGLDRVGKERGWKIVAMVKGGCPVPDMPDMMHARLKRYYHECTRYREAMLQRIAAMRPAGVILSSYDHYVPTNGRASNWQVTPQEWERGLRRTYTRLAAAKVPIVAIRGTPRPWFDVPACLSRQAASLPFSTSCQYDRAKAMVPAAIDAQTRAARGLPVRFVDMNDQVCPATRCSVVRNGEVVFTDDNHLTASFSRSTAPVLGARIAAALRS